jgi:hypothetical protein
MEEEEEEPLRMPWENMDIQWIMSCNFALHWTTNDHF